MFNLLEQAVADANLYWKCADPMSFADVQVMQERELSKASNVVCKADFVPEISGTAGVEVTRLSAAGKADTGNKQSQR